MFLWVSIRRLARRQLYCWPVEIFPARERWLVASPLFVVRLDLFTGPRIQWMPWSSGALGGLVFWCAAPAGGAFLLVLGGRQGDCRHQHQRGESGRSKRLHHNFQADVQWQALQGTEVPRKRPLPPSSANR